jgi:DNA-binding transcriptional LysR family regulator
MRGTAVSKRIRLGVPDDYLDRFVAQPVEGLMAAYPGLQVEIFCDFSRRLETMLEERQLDLAIITRDAARPRGELLRREQPFWCAAPDRHLEFADPLPLALFPEVCRARPMVLQALEKAGRRWRLAYSCSHLQGICGAVARGIAVTVLPASIIPANLRRLGPESGLPELPHLELALLMREQSCPASRQLANNLRRSFGDSSSGG